MRARFPAWNADAFPHGTYGAEGGYAESGKVIARLVEEARRLGVELRDSFLGMNARAVGMELEGVALLVHLTEQRVELWVQGRLTAGN